MNDAASRLASVREQIARAARAARRDAKDITLIAVTKQRSAADIEQLIAHVRQTVEQVHGVKLTPEVRIVGDKL